MASSGASIREIIDYLRSSKSFSLTPMTFLAIAQEALNIPFAETRKLYEYLDTDLRPLSDDAKAEVDRLGNELLGELRSS